MALEHCNGPHDLHGEMLHSQSATSGLANEGISVRHQGFERSPGSCIPADLATSSQQFLICQLRQAFTQLDDVIRERSPPRQASRGGNESGFESVEKRAGDFH